MNHTKIVTQKLLEQLFFCQTWKISLWCSLICLYGLLVSLSAVWKQHYYVIFAKISLLIIRPNICESARACVNPPIEYSIRPLASKYCGWRGVDRVGVATGPGLVQGGDNVLRCSLGRHMCSWPCTCVVAARSRCRCQARCSPWWYKFKF